MIEIPCTCGVVLQAEEQDITPETRCPNCNTLVSSLLSPLTSLPEAPNVPLASDPAKPETTTFRSDPGLPNCVNHANLPAAYNCIVCGKPICMTCFREAGYFCSDPCKQSAKESEPTLPRDNTQGVIDQKIARVSTLVRKLARLAIWPAVAIVALVVGWLVYNTFFGPKPQVTAAFPFDPVRGQVVYRPLDDNRAVIQIGEELSLVDLTSKAKIWNISLATWEEQYLAPRRDEEGKHVLNEDGDLIWEQAKDFDGNPIRDKLDFAALHQNHLLLKSGRQLIAANAETGKVNWKFFDFKTNLGEAIPHDGGLLVQVAEFRKPPQWINFAWADGHSSWKMKSRNDSITDTVVIGKQLAMLRMEIPKKHRRQIDGETEIPEGEEMTDDGETMPEEDGTETPPLEGEKLEEEMTEPDDAPISDDATPEAKAAAIVAKTLGKALGTNSGKQSLQYTLELVSLADGKTATENTIKTTIPPQLSVQNGLIVMMAGRVVTLFDDSGQRIGKAELDAPAGVLIANRDLIVTKIERKLIGISVATGQEKWTREIHPVELLAFGPDGSVYATIRIDKREIKNGEAKTYGVADILYNYMDATDSVLALVQIDPLTGKTLWGIKNIGEHVFFSDQHVYVSDFVEPTALDTGDLAMGSYGLRCIRPQDGKIVWSYLQKGKLHEHQVRGNRFLSLVEPLPRNFELQIIERK